MKGLSSVAIIPARAGSKRIPGKNTRLFLGKPIIAYSIEAAISSGLFNEVMVSTDSEEIANLAINLGASAPFLRSRKNSDDYATLANVVFEVLNRLADSGRKFDFSCCILPSSPFVKASNIIKAQHLLENENLDSVFPVVRFSSSIFRSFRRHGNKIQMYWPEYRDIRTQDLEPAFYDAGQFYCLRTEAFLKNRTIFTENSGYIELEDRDTQDIDTLEDWGIAEFKYRYYLEK